MSGIRLNRLVPYYFYCKSTSIQQSNATETLTFLGDLDFQWLPRAPGKDSESEEGDAPRLRPQSLDQDSEPTTERENWNGLGRKEKRLKKVERREKRLKKIGRREEEGGGRREEGGGRKISEKNCEMGIILLSVPVPSKA